MFCFNDKPWHWSFYWCLLEKPCNDHFLKLKFGFRSDCSYVIFVLYTWFSFSAVLCLIIDPDLFYPVIERYESHPFIHAECCVEALVAMQKLNHLPDFIFNNDCVYIFISEAVISSNEDGQAEGGLCVVCLASGCNLLFWMRFSILLFRDGISSSGGWFQNKNICVQMFLFCFFN